MEVLRRAARGPAERPLQIDEGPGAVVGVLRDLCFVGSPPIFILERSVPLTGLVRVRVEGRRRLEGAVQ